jgi:cytidyltransferase-like protein
MCRGVFDLLHVAHVRHLEEARAMGDRLVVSLTPDETAAKEKRRPMIPENERREMLLGLRFVDAVDLRASWRDSILQWRPSIYVKGHDHKLTVEEREFCEAYGVKVASTKPNPQHTRSIIGRIKECA